VYAENNKEAAHMSGLNNHISQPILDTSFIWFPLIGKEWTKQYIYRGADKSLARPTSRCILFYGENIYFAASLLICIKSTNIPPIMILIG
jgi:hypothetical protein